MEIKGKRIKKAVYSYSGCILTYNLKDNGITHLASLLSINHISHLTSVFPLEIISDVGNVKFSFSSSLKDETGRGGQCL